MAALSMTAAGMEKRLDTEKYIEGYATTFDDPYLLFEDMDGIKYYEIVDRHALDTADMSDVILQYDHQGKVMARTTNHTILLEPDGHGLFTCADLSRSRAAEDMYQEIQNELITKMSWAFRVLEDAYDRATHTRTILRVAKVYDVSAVSLPANVGTEISARSWLDGVIEAGKRESLALKRRRIQLLIQTNGGKQS